MVVNTVLSVMAYDYPPEKLAVYLSDDAGSRLTYYSLLEASQFSEHWLPYCRNFNVEPRSPSAYFKTIAVSPPHPNQDDSDFMEIKRLYQEMEDRIETAMKLGRIPEEVMSKHRGFSQWTTSSSQRDHDTILQIIIDGKGLDARDSEGFALPTLVYLAREKRPQYAHNFKAGAMNALIRVSSEISKGQVTLNVDCDMYSNNSQSVRDALCFLMDEEKGHEIAFVQFPQNFDNITKNELYSSSLRVLSEVEFHGLDGCGGPLYVGSGCFHRRDALSGKRFSKGDSIRLKLEKNVGSERESDVTKLEQSLKVLADCTYEEDTQWGKEMGLKYGSLVEDVITGLSIQCRGWKSVYFNPARKGFLGVAPTTLCQTLVQHKRWSEGDFQIFFSKYSPPIYGFGKLSLGLQMGYCTYCFWVPNCLATIYYSLIPSLSLVKGIQLFPQMPSPWFLVFAYVILAKYSYSLGEFIWSGGTIRGWWNDQRIWLFKRTSSYLLAFIDTILWLLGFSGSAFVITTKASDKDVSLRYEKEMMEFGTSSLMFTILTVIALTNLLCFIKTLAIGDGRRFYQTIDLQILLCGLLVLINLPLYNALFVRRDSGKMPVRLTINSIFLVLLLLFYSVFML